jgi:hypothetical protein
MTASTHPARIDELTAFGRLPAPSPRILADAIRLISMSGQDSIGPATLWAILQDNAIGADGFTTCIALQRLGLLIPSDRAGEQGKVWSIHPALRDATLAARVSAKVWIEAVVAYVEAGYRKRDQLLDVDGHPSP